MERIYITAAQRTPQGRFLGALAEFSSIDLGVRAGKAVLRHLRPEAVDQVIIGNVLGAGAGMNIARQIGVNLGIPVDRPAFTVNMMCASGMKAVMLAAETIIAGSAETVLCGGTESMSASPYLLARARGGYKLGDGVLIDSLMKDGLIDSFANEHMGAIAERIADTYQVSRADQDSFALASHKKWARAQAAGKFDDELVRMEELDKDEHPRPDTTPEKMASLKPAFGKDGTVTAGNASGINDGASLLIVCNEMSLRRNRWQPLAAITGWSAVGCDPAMMGMGPVYATQKLCAGKNIDPDVFDTIELNEAFASQSIACIRELKIDPEKVNREGGAIAMGHPIGNSGSRILVHLAHRIARKETSMGLATLCVGGGMGTAVLLQAP